MTDKYQNSKFESLQDIAIKVIEEQNKQIQLDNNPKERTVFILGSRGVGKTTIINKFFDRNENSRPTLSLDYSYSRRSSSGLNKQIFNLWELGSLENSDELIDIPLTSHNLENFTIVIVLDLSEPNHIWSDLSRAIKSIKNSFSKIIETDISEYYERAIQRISNDAEHPDLKTLNLFPLPILIVGGKYDVFQDFDPEIKKQICIFLRSVAHILGAGLLFYSQKISLLAKTIRDTLNHFGFGSPSHPFRKISIDYNEPLIIWFGNDSWEKIGVMPTKIEMIGINFSNKFPQINEGMKALPDDPATDVGFKESVIDEMKSQKNEEITLMLKETSVKSKFEIIKL